MRRGRVFAAVCLGTGLLAAAACGDDADATGGSKADAAGADATIGGGDASGDATGSDAPALHDAAGDVVTVFGPDDGGACVLPANTCDDGTHLRTRSNLRADAGADGGECAWDEQVVDCTQLGGEACIGGQCTVVLR